MRLSSWLRKPIAQAPEWDEPYYLAGVSLYFIRRFRRSGAKPGAGRGTQSEFRQSFFHPGGSAGQPGKHAEAEQCFRRAIALQPENARFHCHLGMLLMRQNQYAKAEESFRKAIELKPAYGLSHYELGKLLVHSERWQAAAEELSKAVRRTTQPGPSLLSVGARLFPARRSGKIEAHVRRIQEALTATGKRRRTRRGPGPGRRHQKRN